MGSTRIPALGGSGGDTLPVEDTTALVHQTGDATALVRIDASNVPTGTTLDIVMSNVSVNLTPGVSYSTAGHETDLNNPHGTTADQVGLGNVLNVEQVPVSEKGAPLGVATLDANGNVVQPAQSGGQSDGVSVLANAQITGWPPNTAKLVSLSPAAADVGQVAVRVWEDMPPTNSENTDWTFTENLIANSIAAPHNYAGACALTPSATTGTVTITRASGSWSAADVGRLVVGNSGRAVVTAQGGGATATVHVLDGHAFADTTEIASGGWALYEIDDKDGTVVLPSYPGGVNTEFLIESETADGSTTFLDSTGNHVLTPANQARHSTAQAKFGTSSIRLDGTDDTVHINHTAALNFADLSAWTLEFWIRADNLGLLFSTYENGNDVNTGLIFYGGRIYISSNGSWFNIINGAIVDYTIQDWCHVAVSFDGTHYRCFKNGVAFNTTASASRVWYAQTGFTLGRAKGASSGIYGCYIEDFRFTSGTALYTANFTPPGKLTALDVLLLNKYVAVPSGANGVMPSSSWTTLNAIETTEVGSGTAIYYALTFDGGSTYVVLSGANLRTVVRNNAGVWEYNSHATFGSTNWTEAAVNTSVGAIEEAMAVAANRMNKTSLEAATPYPVFGVAFGFAIVLYATGPMPANGGVSGIKFNHGSALRVVDRTHVYTIDHETANTVRVRTPDREAAVDARVVVIGPPET